MGMEYYLKCLDCNKKSKKVEFSIVRSISLKYPDDVEEDFIIWSKFLIKHSGHRIIFVDEYGNQTNPAKITGAYVIGLESYKEKKK